MTVDIKGHAQPIVRALANAMGVEAYSLCFCGSGKKFKFCCYQSSPEELVFLEGAIENAVKYRNSVRRNIDKIPLGLFTQFSKASLSRLKCLYPNCNEKPVSCHLIPRNILRKSFGDSCNECRLDDGTDTQVESFLKTPTSNAGTLPVFCSQHDNDLFSSIDTLEIDFTDKEQLFLLSFKAIAFALRRNQYLLGMDSQIMISSPKFILESPDSKVRAGMNIPINISYLHTQYIRFCIIHDLFLRCISALENKNWGFFTYLYRNISVKEDIFFAGFLNPSHDLEGTRINNAQTPINMSCNAFTKDGTLHVVFGCPDGASKAAYAKLLEQIANADDETFIAILNNVMTISSEKPLISEKFTIAETDIEKIRLLNEKAGHAMNASSIEVLDLKDTDQAIQFIQ